MSQVVTTASSNWFAVKDVDALKEEMVKHFVDVDADKGSGHVMVSNDCDGWPSIDPDGEDMDFVEVLRPFLADGTRVILKSVSSQKTDVAFHTVIFGTDCATIHINDEDTDFLLRYYAENPPPADKPVREEMIHFEP